MTDFVYKVLTLADDAAFATDPDRGYGGSPDDLRDGYIHLSNRDQLAGTLAAHYRAPETVMLLTLAVSALPPDRLRWERSRGGALFPHLYDRLPAAAVARRDLLCRDPDGTFILPWGML